MTIKKSPFPYIIILLIIISSALYSRLTIDRFINQPILHSIEKETVSEPVIITSKTTLKHTTNSLALTNK